MSAFLWCCKKAKGNRWCLAGGICGPSHVLTGLWLSSSFSEHATWHWWVQKVCRVSSTDLQTGAACTELGVWESVSLRCTVLFCPMALSFLLLLPFWVVQSQRTRGWCPKRRQRQRHPVFCKAGPRISVWESHPSLLLSPDFHLPSDKGICLLREYTSIENTWH